MLLYIAAGLTAIWIVGMLTSYTIGGIIHILPLFSIIILVLNFDNGKRICG